MTPARIGAIATALIAASGPAAAASAFTCGSFALQGGAEILCSHTDPAAPPQICTFSWSLMGSDNALKVAQGTFLLTPGQSNVVVYQGSAFAYALSNPVVLCQGRRVDR